MFNATRNSLLCAALLIFTLSGCATSTTLPEPPPIATCGKAALEFCDPPAPGRSDRMGESEAEDDANRALWLQCIERHRGAVLCLRRIRAAGAVQVVEEVRAP